MENKLLLKKFRLSIKISCFVILILQLINVSIDYFSYPFGIKVDISYDETHSLPAITLCTQKDFICNKSHIENIKSGVVRKYSEIIQKYIHYLQVGEKVLYESTRELKAHFTHKHNNLNQFIFNELYGKYEHNLVLNQLSNTTLKLEEFIECKLKFEIPKFNNYTEVNCLSKSRTIQIFEKNNVFGKCFTYFHENEFYENQKEIKISRNDFIEFKLSEKLIDEVIHKVGDYYVLYISIHSNKTGTGVSNFHNLPLLGLKFVLSFGKIFYKSLSKPYSSQCRDKNDIKQMDSFQDCIPNPLVQNWFQLSNKSYSRNIKICGEEMHYKPNIHKDCRTHCNRDCREEYFYSKAELIQAHEESNKIRIKVENHPFYIYEAFPKYSLLIYLTNIGGLMSLWLGISALNLYNLVLKLIKYLKLISLPKIENFFSYIKPYLRKFMIFLHKIEKLKCKNLTKLICICCYFYQFFELTNEYLAYKYTVKYTYY
jgi:hypothetical protein